MSVLKLDGLRVLRALLAIALTGVCWAAAAAEPAQRQDVRAWLLRIHEAASHHNFQGTFVVSSGGAVSSARIAHYCEGPNQYERSASLDGQTRYVYRYNNVVHTLWPGTRVALIEQRNLIASFPALLQAGDDRISDFYDVRHQGRERMAGHQADVLVVQPKDSNRYGYRLWADQSTGLLLRADVLGEHNEVLETSAFSEVTIGVKAQPEQVLQPMKKLDGFRVVRPSIVPTRLDAEGWTLKIPVPGFHEVSCVKRAIDETPDSQEAEPGLPQAVQTIYSDGLTYVSVFIEPYNPRLHTRQLLTAVGATQTFMTRRDDWWLTVVGDVPPSTLRRFAQALTRAR